MPHPGYRTLRAYWASLPKAGPVFGGRRTLIRPLRPDDLEIERAFVGSLSAESLSSRVLSAGVTVSDESLHRLVEVDQRTHIAIAVTLPLHDGAETLLGVGRYALTPDGRTAEFAITVRDDWQGKGLGTLLVEELIACAKAAGIHVLGGDVLRGNDAMMALLRKLGFSMLASEDGPALAYAFKRLRRVRRVALPAGILA